MSVCSRGSCSLPGPIPRTVRDPAAICVRPLIENVRLQLKGIMLSSITHASCIDLAQRLRLLAIASNVSSSSSSFERNATFVCLSAVQYISIKLVRLKMSIHEC